MFIDLCDQIEKAVSPGGRLIPNILRIGFDHLRYLRVCHTVGTPKCDSHVVDASLQGGDGWAFARVKPGARTVYAGEST